LEAKVFHINAKLSDHLLFTSSLKEDAKKLVKAAPNEASNLRICGFSMKGVVRLLNELGTTRVHYPQPLMWNEASKDVP